MTALEIVMLIIGIVCFGTSFVLTKDDAEPVTKRRGSSHSNYKPELTNEQIEEIKGKVENVVSEQMSMLEETTEAALDKISNTKILEMNEYANTVMNEINKNHNETVFMYDMLNDKAKEIKNLVKDVNQTKTEIEAVSGDIWKNAEYLDKLIHDSEKTVKEMDIAIKAAYRTKAVVESLQTEPKVPDNVIMPKAFEKKEEPSEMEIIPQMDYMPKAEPESILASNYNDQILLLHSQGKSNLEIAKTLNLGMGEVKLVIDLFHKNR